MTITLVGVLKDVGIDELDGTFRITANKVFVDSSGDVHVEKTFDTTITNGEIEIEMEETINNVYVQASGHDTGHIISWTAVPLGTLGNSVTVKIEAGTNPSTSKLTIVYGTITETYNNLNMDETAPATYIVDAINAASSLVTISRLSGTGTDTLPTNQIAIALTGGTTTNQVKYKGTETLKYKFEFIDTNGVEYEVLDNVQITYSASDIELSSLFT